MIIYKMFDLAKSGMKTYKINIEKINDFSKNRFYDVGSSLDIYVKGKHILNHYSMRTLLKINFPNKKYILNYVQTI